MTDFSASIAYEAQDIHQFLKEIYFTCCNRIDRESASSGAWLKVDLTLPLMQDLREALDPIFDTKNVRDGILSAMNDVAIKVRGAGPLKTLLAQLPSVPTDRPIGETLSRTNDIALVLCAEIDRIENLHSSIDQSLPNADRTVTMHEGLSHFVLETQLTHIAETEKAISAAALETKSPQGRYALEALSHFWPAGDIGEPVVKKLENITLITNHWRSDLAQQGVSIVELLDRSSMDQANGLNCNI